MLLKFMHISKTILGLSITITMILCYIRILILHYDIQYGIPYPITQKLANFCCSDIFELTTFEFDGNIFTRLAAAL